MYSYMLEKKQYQAHTHSYIHISQSSLMLSTIYCFACADFLNAAQTLRKKLSCQDMKVYSTDITTWLQTCEQNAHE